MAEIFGLSNVASHWKSGAAQVVDLGGGVNNGTGTILLELSACGIILFRSGRDHYVGPRRP